MYFIRRVKRFIDLVGEYYAIAMTFWGALLFASAHLHFLFWATAAAALPLAMWSGYLAHMVVVQRNQRHGFKLISDAMTYEVNAHRRYALQYSTKLKACTNQIMVYPVGHQWSGTGEESIPKVTGEGHLLLAPLEKRSGANPVMVPYRLTTSAGGEWHYAFVALNPPANKDDVVKIKYRQEFWDKKGTARPSLYYFVRVPMDRLELSVKFGKGVTPKSVKSGYIKTSDPLRVVPVAGVSYDPGQQQATWVIKNPKRGHCYGLQWEE